MTLDTRTALLDKAEHAARARGFDGFSYGDLAEAVGIRKASIHYHFPTKAGLSVALMERYAQNMATMRADIARQDTKASHRLLGLIRLYRDALNNGKTLCLCVALTTSRQSLSAEVNDQISNFRKDMVTWIAEVFARGMADKSIAGVCDPQLEAPATLALLEGAHLAARAEEDLSVFDQALAALKSRC